MFKTLFVIVKCLLVSVVAVQHLKIISIVSNSSDADTPLWGRGEELIPGALLAAEQVNSNEDVLNEFHIEVAPLFVQDCSVSEGILETVKELLTTDHPVIGVTGLFCPTLVEVLSPLFSHRELNLIQLSGATIVDHAVAEDKNSQHILSVVSGIEAQVKALFNLMEALNWSRFNLVTIWSSKPLEDYYTKLAEQVMSSSMTNSHFFEIKNLVLQSELKNSVEHLVEQLRLSTSPIFVVALPPETAADLLCHAFMNKMTWPRYGWIMLDLTVNESAQCGGESLLRAMESVIVLQTELEQDDNLTLISGNSYSNYKHNIQKTFSSLFNPYTNVLYDSVWALALAVNSSLQHTNIQVLRNSNRTFSTKTKFGTLPGVANQIAISLMKTSFTGASGKFQNGRFQTPQEMYQIQDESFVLFGKLCSYANSTSFYLDLLNKTRPQDVIPRISRLLPVSATSIMLSISSLCVVFVTVLLVIFLCYWKHPEVRASSRALSLCIFLGCYLLLASALGRSLSESITGSPSYWCIVFSGCCYIGVDLILATVLAKTLRIAYVFTKFKKTGRACSDVALFAMIALIVSGKLLILSLWSAIDLYHTVEVLELATDGYGLPYYTVFERCYSQYVVVWLLIIFAYSFAVSIPLLILAYRTRKIKQEHLRHFKDTKKINAFIFFLVMFGGVGIPLWTILWIVSESQMIDAYVVFAGLTGVSVMCQVFLIIPKIGPVLKKTFHSYCVSLISKYSAS